MRSPVNQQIGHITPDVLPYRVYFLIESQCGVRTMLTVTHASEAPEATGFDVDPKR